MIRRLLHLLRHEWGPKYKRMARIGFEQVQVGTWRYCKYPGCDGEKYD